MTPTTDNFSRQRLLENLQKVAQYVVRKAQNLNALRSIVSIWKNENGVFEFVGGKSHDQNLSNFMYKILCSDDSFNTFYCLTITICIFYIVSLTTAHQTITGCPRINALLSDGL